MPKLQQVMKDVAKYNWNATLQMFDATVWRRMPDGSEQIIAEYALPPHIFWACHEGMMKAWAQFETCQGHNVVEMRRTAEGH
jgi:hypothetical protein